MSNGRINLDAVRAHLDQILDKRAHPKTMCPSEAARALTQEELEESGAAEWRELMGPLRELAFELRDSGEIEILQKGNILPIDQTCDKTTGPIRLRRSK